MKKIFKLSALGILMGLSAGALAANPAAVRHSATGHVFTQVSQYPELGEAWMDEGGLVWGDLVQKSQMPDKLRMSFCRNPEISKDDACRMTPVAAVQYCQTIGATLPSRDQFLKLDSYLGDSDQTMDMDGNYLNARSQDAIPNLRSLSYWSSTYEELPGVEPKHFVQVFEYGADAALKIQAHDMITDYAGGGLSVTRCVR